FRATSLETLRQMVAAGVGITLLPNLAVQPPIAPSADIHLVPFRGDPPSRRIAMAWRRSSAMGAFLKRLAAIVRALPRELFDARATARPRKSAATARRSSRV
ncbi:MAG TPA: LysR substrate-binding domain-containing protein, partial [Dokdonella sp.]|nr:LysR substrate-binding domain-containing protein [Dokdonella sp.]